MEKRTTIEIIIDYIKDAIKSHPIKDGNDYEHNVYYMNGNDGTMFDWQCNDRTCEFFVWYATEKQLGYLKVYATKQGNIEGYIYDTERYGDGEKLTPLYIGEGKAKTFAHELDKYFDRLNKWDSVFCGL